MNPKKPAASRIRKLCTQKSFERGQGYHNQGRVERATISRGIVTAHVEGRMVYRVMVSLLPGDATSVCTCPYADAGVCKHIVAVMLHASKNFRELLKEESSLAACIDDAFDGLSAAQMKGFLVTEMESDEGLRGRFMSRFGRAGSMPPRDYRREIDALYGNADCDARRYGVAPGFYRFFGAAKACEEGGDPAEAARIYREISEAITRNVGVIDNTDGDNIEDFDNAMRGMTSCTMRQKSGREQRRLYISYLVKQFVGNDSEYFEDVYCRSIEETCTDRQDLAYWRDALAPALPDAIPDSRRRYGPHLDAVRLVQMQLDVLERLEDGSLEDVYRAHYRSSQDICARYIAFLQKSDPGRARQIAKEGEELFAGREFEYAVGRYGKGETWRAKFA